MAKPQVEAQWRAGRRPARCGLGLALGLLLVLGPLRLGPGAASGPANATAPPDALPGVNQTSSCQSDQLQAGPAAASAAWAVPGASGPADEAHQQRASFGFTQPAVSEFARPTYYTLRLKLDPTKRRFTGQLMVALEVAEPATGAPGPANATGHRYLSLHAGANLHIRRAFYVFSSRGSVQVPATRIGRNLEAELLTLDFHPNLITAGQGLLLLVYAGTVNDTDSHGLFVHRSHRARRAQQVPPADDGLGLATHMEPSFARRLFPGWDEPQFKARFSLIVVLPFRGYECLSNMPVKRKSISLSCSGEPLQEVEFQTSPAMSSYLVALVVGRFEHVEAPTAGQCQVRVHFYGGPELAARRAAAQPALELAVGALELLERRLGVRYPLAKLDLVALRDFASGAMENWGAATFHENYLLVDNSSQLGGDVRVAGGAPRPRRLVVPLVVAHELAHQWFGNLVTPSSWRFLWLSEGFAQLLMYELADELQPAGDYRRLFLEDSRAAALHEDELLTSGRPLEPQLAPGEALAPADQLELFDQLTYNKGAALLAGLQLALGRDQFAAGLRHYLVKHSYGSVDSAALWAALEEATGRPERQLELLCADWLRLAGLPVLSLQLSETRDHYRLRLSQERFTLLAAANASAGHWQLLVSLASERRPAPAEAELRLWAAAEAPMRAPAPATPPLLLLAERRATLELPKAQLGAWFKLNVNATGYYRVDYAPAPAAPDEQPVDMWARLAGAARASQLNELERFNLHDDLFAMVLAGRKSLAFYLRQLTEVFGAEREPLVLRSVVDSLERVRSALVSNSPLVGELGPLFERFVAGYLRRLDGRASSLVLASQSAGLELLECARLQFGDPQSVGWAQAEFARALLGRTPARVAELAAGRELRAAVYAAGLARASGAQLELAWRRLLELYEAADAGAPERAAISQALGSVRDQARLGQLLNLTLSPASAPHFRQQDAALVVESMAKWRVGRQLVWAQLVAEAGALAGRQLLAPALRALARGLLEPPASSGPAEAPFEPLELQLRQLYADQADEHGKLIGQTIEWLRINTHWYRRDHDELLRFLRAWSGRAPR